MKAKVLLVLLLVGAAFAAPTVAQQPAAVPTVKAVQPGLLEVTGPRVNDAVAAGIQKITAVPGKGRKSIEVKSPWGNIYFDWPKDVKPVAFTIENGKGGATISAPGFTEASKADYKAAIEAVVPKAIKDAQDQKTARTKK